VKLAFFIDSVEFTPDVIAGTASLGGSESACLGLCRALQARGHSVSIFATKLAEGCDGPDAWGVTWDHARNVYEVSQFIEWDVFCALRIPAVFSRPIRARLRLLWNQDMLIGEQAKSQVMSVAWAIDNVVYVSQYHRKQWEGVLPELQPIGWVTKNGYDPSLVPTDAVKHPKRIIHISRPERGLVPLLQMWPKLRELVPDAELQICRYNSMYDAQGWGKVCAQFDQMVETVNQQVGGITYLGELGKPALYKAIAEAAVMWYPGIVDFAETSCIAAIEAQANGTPFVGSFKGALPETVPSGVLFSGDAMSPEYQIASVQAVATMLRDAQRNAVHYRELQKAGREHVQAYTHDVIAGEWEQWLTETFAERYETNKSQVLERLLHEDDHTAALKVADRIIGVGRDHIHIEGGDLSGTSFWPLGQAIKAYDLCESVITGEEQGADDYAKFAIQDPLAEWQISARFHSVAPWFKDCRAVLDVACGNGALAIGLALSHPEIRVVGLDYAEQNIAHAKAAAERAGVADRLTFIHATVWNFQRGDIEDGVQTLLSTYGPFDGLFVGEFLEHIGDAPGLIDSLERLVATGALVVYTVPNGPFSELLERHIPRKRGHVHHFQHDDLTEVFGQKRDIQFQYFDVGVTPRGSQVGHWLIQYRAAEGGPRARIRPYAERITRTRPHPKLSVGIIAKNAGLDIARCLESVWPIADEIVVGDTGSEDDTKEIAARYGATVLDLPSLDDDPDGFSGARNKVLDACTGEWFLWIDTDEVLCGREQLWKYLDTTVYHGFAIKQNHVSIQDAPYFDRPVRVFRRTQPIRFYGCIHEQPQMHDCNGDITPALAVDDVQIAHLGYLTEGVVRRKLFNRNLPLLMKDQQCFAERRLGKLLTLRDCINLAEHEREQNGGRLTDGAKKYYSQAVGIFEKEWLGRFEDKYYGLARPFYERALREIAGAYEFEVALAGRQHTLGNGRAKTERVMVRKLEHVDAIVTHLLASVHKQAEPVTVDVEPVAKSQQPTPVEAA
jgi:glycosyltransferase involved in cell wall biosynthesis/SAM-dependent methyltransferase